MQALQIPQMNVKKNEITNISSDKKSTLAIYPSIISKNKEAFGK